MKTCKDCQHWLSLGDWFETVDGIEVRRCSHPMVRNPTMGLSHAGPKMIPAGVYREDEGGCTGHHLTGPDFGCIHFSPKS